MSVSDIKLHNTNLFQHLPQELQLLIFLEQLLMQRKDTELCRGIMSVTQMWGWHDQLWQILGTNSFISLNNAATYVQSITTHQRLNTHIQHNVIYKQWKKKTTCSHKITVPHWTNSCTSTEHWQLHEQLNTFLCQLATFLNSSALQSSIHVTDINNRQLYNRVR